MAETIGTLIGLGLGIYFAVKMYPVIRTLTLAFGATPVLLMLLLLL